MADNKFLNVKAEITRAGFNVSSVATMLNISPQALYGKLSGNSEFTLSDMEAIRKILSQRLGIDLTLDYLFGDNNGD